VRVEAERTRIATRAVSRCACRAQVPNPFVAKCVGFPSSAWARQIYLPSERTLERASDGAPGPAIGAADFTGPRVGDRTGAAVHVFSSYHGGVCGETETELGRDPALVAYLAIEPIWTAYNLESRDRSEGRGGRLK
jgi:hypothetical protein